MKTIAALQDPDLLLAGPLMTHRRGEIKGKPYLRVSVFCPFCRHHHYFPWPDVFRLDAVVGPVAMPCRGSPYAGFDVYIGLDCEERADQRRLSEAFTASLRRFETQRRLERQLAESRAEDRAYLRQFPDAAFSTAPADYIATGWVPAVPAFTHSPSAPI